MLVAKCTRGASTQDPRGELRRLAGFQGRSGRIGAATATSGRAQSYHPDRRSWRWKDEDEFRFGIDHGWYTLDQLSELKALGLSIARNALAGRPPFNAGWEQWRPPADWRPLDLPAGFDS